ncbi:MAG: glycosyltransferase family protein [Xanthobacteraceae bacterium]
MQHQSDRQVDLAAPKILDIGEAPLMREAYPATTEYWSTEPVTSVPMGPQDRTVDAATLPRLMRRLADPSLDLIVVQPTNHAPWSLSWLVRSLFRRSTLRGTMPFFRAFGQELLRGRFGAPLAVWDWEEQPFVFRHNTFLLDRATLYFKRELPPDHWRVFMGSQHYRVPTARFRMIEQNRARVAKLRPISLGVPRGRLDLPTARPLPASEKTADVFFTGRVEDSTTVRQRGLEEMKALRAKGIRVDVPENNLALTDYLDRCARAWLVWSPEGYGYECFRTYEAAICGSVPVVNRQTVERHRPLRDGEHCFYYDVEPGGLTRTIETALADRDRLMAMSAAAREFVLANHTLAALARYVAETTLASAGRA